jgi:hypothetical protein
MPRNCISSSIVGVGWSWSGRTARRVAEASLVPFITRSLNSSHSRSRSPPSGSPFHHVLLILILTQEASMHHRHRHGRLRKVHLCPEVKRTLAFTGTPRSSLHPQPRPRGNEPSLRSQHRHPRHGKLPRGHEAVRSRSSTLLRPAAELRLSLSKVQPGAQRRHPHRPQSLHHKV